MDEIQFSQSGQKWAIRRMYHLSEYVTFRLKDAKVAFGVNDILIYSSYGTPPRLQL